MTMTTANPTEQTASPINVTGQPVTPDKGEKAIEAIKSHIMANRGTTYPEHYSPKNLLNASGLKDGEKAANRIAAALIRRQRIVLVADFDCDGATGAAVMKRGLDMISDAMIGSGDTGKRKAANSHEQRADIQYVIPDRFEYGYGLKPSLAIEVIQPLNPDLVITIDNGISSHNAIDQMKTWVKAPDVIITDHHAPADTLPDAYAVVNPNRRDCSFESKALCGCGVAFYVLLLVRRAIVALIGDNPRGAIMAARMRNVALNHLSDLVALGTIGDMVPMDANNRLLVKVGLDRINKGIQMTARASHTKGLLSYGIRALLERAGVGYPVTATDLAFQVVPRINSVGRLTKPVAGVECLLSDSHTIAELEAQKCDELNQERKQVQATMEMQARDSLSKMLEAPGAQALADDEKPASVVLDDNSWHPGLVGLIASRIKEKTGGAVVCFAPETGVTKPDEQTGTGEQDDWRDADLPDNVNPNDADINWLKGSGRSDNVHLRDALAYVASHAPDLMMQFGGHARAAGLTLYRPHLPRFRRLFAEAVDHLLATAPLENRQFDDGPLPAIHRSFPLAHWIERQPWGQMFPEPQFTQQFRVARARTMKDVHQRLVVVDANANPSDGQSGSAEPLTMVWFFSVNDETPALEEGQLVTLQYRLTVNRLNGKNSLQGVVVKRVE
ncbi:single-stranded-DNA-specific exonuclease RecJ [Marinobacter subterrani]|uniref:single-stranded-DNA-specific exonuclease RecJ n=1 Tax=Marinobacter subterrani TaxID=1658765 RepID=UPI0023574BD6|nr:DHH family phosphoesterase [Marinobacter subterrani]